MNTHSNHQLKSRFSKLFSKHNKSSSSVNNRINQGEEWDILRAACPECEKEHVDKSKSRYHYKPIKSAAHLSATPKMTHVPFPATLTLIDSHPHLAEGTLALRVCTEPVPTDETMHLSCTATSADWKWNTPDGAMDFLLPADSNGKVMSSNPKGVKCNSNQEVTPTKDKMSSPPYQIMERIIPISSIDHVSRGGDAWDILRQSTGIDDHGCSCDVKIHGFSDRLLRFDLVNFDTLQSNGANDCGLGHNFAGVDFSEFSSAGAANNSLGGEGHHVDIAPKNKTTWRRFDTYTAENVISTLNSIVTQERRARKSGVASWKRGFTRYLEEYLSLGVTHVDDPCVHTPPVKGNKRSREWSGVFDIDSNYRI